MQTLLMAATKPSINKPNTFRLYLSDEDKATMMRIAEITELGQTGLLSKLVSAGLKAIVANNNRVALPLRFKVSEAETETNPYRLNDAPIPSKQRK